MYNTVSFSEIFDAAKFHFRKFPYLILTRNRLDAQNHKNKIQFYSHIAPRTNRAPLLFMPETHEGATILKKKQTKHRIRFLKTETLIQFLERFRIHGGCRDAKTRRSKRIEQEQRCIELQLDPDSDNNNGNA